MFSVSRCSLFAAGLRGVRLVVSVFSLYAGLALSMPVHKSATGRAVPESAPFVANSLTGSTVVSCANRGSQGSKESQGEASSTVSGYRSESDARPVAMRRLVGLTDHSWSIEQLAAASSLYTTLQQRQLNILPEFDDWLASTAQDRLAGVIHLLNTFFAHTQAGITQSTAFLTDMVSAAPPERLLEIDQEVIICVASSSYLPAIAKLYRQKGLPPSRDIVELLAWLAGGGDVSDRSLEVVEELFFKGGAQASSAQLPVVADLKKHYQFLVSCGGDSQQQTDKQEKTAELRLLTLFMASDEASRSHLDHDLFLAFQSLYGSSGGLCELVDVLACNGVAGLRLLLKIQDKLADSAVKTLALKAISTPTSMPVAEYVLEHFPPEQWKGYCLICQHFERAPTDEQWASVTKLIKTIRGLVPQERDQQTLLGILWQLNPEDRERYSDERALAAILDVLPNVSVLGTLIDRLSPVTGRDPQVLIPVLDACVSFVSDNCRKASSLVPLFNALLLVHQRLKTLDPVRIPNHIFSDRGPLPLTNTGVLIYEKSKGTSDLLHFFVVAVLDQLAKISCSCSRDTLRITQHANAVTAFKKPDLSPHPHGIQITNWSVDEFNIFVTSTGINPNLFSKAPMPHSSRKKRRYPRVNKPLRLSKNPPSMALSLEELIDTVNNNDKIEQYVWHALNHQRNELPAPVLQRLSTLVPIHPYMCIPAPLKELLATTLSQTPANGAVLDKDFRASSEAVSEELASRLAALCSPSERLAMLWDEATSAGDLSAALLCCLAKFADALTLAQARYIFDKMSSDLPRDTVARWDEIVWEKMSVGAAGAFLLSNLDIQESEWPIDS